MDFFSNIKEVVKSGKIDKIPWEIDGELLYIHLAPILDAWISWFYTKEDEVKGELVRRSDLVRVIKEHPSFVAIGVVKWMGSSKEYHRCVVFKRSIAPNELIEVIYGERMEDSNP